MIKLSIIGLSLIILSSAALSAPIANLKVDGKITAPTCNVNGGNEDVLFDFGKISPGMLNQNVATPFNFVGNKNITVSCDAPTYLTFVTTDTYPLTDYSFYPDINLRPESPTWVYGLVDAQTGKEVGLVTGFVIDQYTVSVDSNKAFIAFVSIGGPRSIDLLMKNRLGGWVQKYQQDLSVSSPSELNLTPGKKI